MCSNAGGGGGGSAITSASLPQLQGSEKQIAWANDIRQNYIDEINEFLKNDDFVFEEHPWGRTTAENLARNLYRDGIITGDDRTWRFRNDEEGVFRYASLQQYQWNNMPGKTWREKEAAADAYYAKWNLGLGNEKVKAWREEAKSKGLEKAERKAYVEAKKKTYYKPYIAEFAKYALSQETSAGRWIDQFKGTKYSKKR